MMVFAHFDAVCAICVLKKCSLFLQFIFFIIFLRQIIFNHLKNYNYVRN